MAEEIDNANKQIIIGRTLDGKYIVLKSSDTGCLCNAIMDSSDIIINPAIKNNQPIPPHKTYFLYGSTSAQTDDLTPASGKRLRIYGFYGAYTVDAAFNPSVAGCIAFGTGCLTDRTKVLGASGDVAGAGTFIFTMTPMNRLGEVDEIIRFKMATYSAGTASGNFVILYNEE